MKRIVVIICVTLIACSGSSSTWKEEILDWDGTRLLVERYWLLGNVFDQELSNVSQGRPIIGNGLRAQLPNKGWSAVWEARGLIPLAVGQKHRTLYLAVIPMLCEDYDRWGRPIPAYVFFKLEAHQWTRIPVQEFPPEIGNANLLLSTSSEAKEMVRSGHVLVEQTRMLNRYVPQYAKQIQRTDVAVFDDCRKRLEMLDRQQSSQSREKRK